MPAHTLHDGNRRQMPRAVGPLANGLWKMEVRGRPKPCSFRPIAPYSSANKDRLQQLRIPRYGYLGKIKNCFTTMAHQSSKIGKSADAVHCYRPYSRRLWKLFAKSGPGDPPLGPLRKPTRAGSRNGTITSFKVGGVSYVSDVSDFLLLVF
jgi:hypothetical protein